jgi:hypothetical protein
MKIGTLSSELCGESMALSGSERERGVRTAIEEFAPDILLTAGWSLETKKDLKVLGRELEFMKHGGVVFVEVRCGSVKTTENTRLNKNEMKHCAFAWTLADGWRDLGLQHLAFSNEVRDAPEKLRNLEAALPRRTVIFKRKAIGLLNCGELNAIQGRNNVGAASATIDQWISKLDFVLNPTHDRMGSPGTLHAKRVWLSMSERGRSRAAISCANWNSQKEVGSRGLLIRQRQDAPTLHTLYVNGRPRTLKRKPFDYFEYREATVS